MKNSGILTWNSENINEAPLTSGVFVLRTSPINGFVRKIELVDNLKQALEEIYDSAIFPEVKFFEWFQSDESEENEKMLAKLKLQYDIDQKTYRED